MKRTPLRTAALAALAATALLAGCSNVTTASDTASEEATATASATLSEEEQEAIAAEEAEEEAEAAEDEDATEWTTISTAVREASVGASVEEILAANDEITDASSEADDAGTWDADSATTVTLADGASTVSGDGASVDGDTITITAEGTYVLSGSLSDGQIIINADKAEVHLVLNGVDITNTDGAAVVVEDTGDMIFVLAEGTENTLTDGETYSDTSDEAPTATLYSADDITITGTGSLNVTGNSNDGISSKNGVVITGDATVNVTAADDGIRGKDYISIESGTVTVTATGDGLKSTEDTDETQGFIALGEATVTITSGADGVQANTDITVDGTDLTIEAGGGSDNAEAETGGMGGQPGQEQESTEDDTDSPKGMDAAVSLTVDDGTVEINAADEGLQAAFLNINGGTVNVHSGDDGINASNSDYTIEGYEDADSESDDGWVYTQSAGVVTIDHAYSDALDANRTGSTNGGLLVVENTPSTPETAIDINGDNTANGVSGSLSISNGETVTVSGDSEQTFTATTDMDSLTVVGLTADTEYTLTTDSGQTASGTASALNNGGGMGGAGGGQGGGQPGGGQGGPGNNG